MTFGGCSCLNALVLLSATVACGTSEARSHSGNGDDGGVPSGNSACSLGIRLSGDATLVRSADEEATCFPVDSFFSGIDVIYVGYESVLSVALRIADVAEGQTGTFPATISIVLTENRIYETGCNVTIGEHRQTGTRADPAGRIYLVAGTGACPNALPQGGGAGSIAISDLAFRIPAVWRE